MIEVSDDGKCAVHTCDCVNRSASNSFTRRINTSYGRLSEWELRVSINTRGGNLPTNNPYLSSECVLGSIKYCPWCGEKLEVED